MENVILQEAFQQLNMLNEEDFNISNNSEEGVEELKDFVDNDEELDTLDVIDPEAETEEELEDSYINKVILDCTVCHSKIYKNVDEVSIDKEADLANIGEDCPYCYSADGYKVIGQVVPFVETEVDIEVEPKEDIIDDTDDIEVEEDEIVEESCKGKNCKKEKDSAEIKENLEKIDIETEHDTIHVETEEKAEAGEEMIAPVEPAIEDEIMGVEEEPVDLNFDSEAPEEPLDSEDDTDFVDYDLEDFDEESFDELGESYLRQVYGNVQTYHTTSATVKGDSLILEGIIRFNSGNSKKTQFIFEAKDSRGAGKVSFSGRNSQICESKTDAFTLSGKFDKTKFISESLRYKYHQKTNEGLKRIHGKVDLKG